MTARLRVVIPAIDEATTLPGLLADLAGQTGVTIETVVVDGGSRDATAAIAGAFGARCMASAPGRGHQMNTGAADFTGDWLLFLHADCRLTSTAQLRDALAMMQATPANTAGHFGLSFVHDNSPAERFLYRYMSVKTRTNRRYSINGDQGCLIRRACFERLGGYPVDLAFFEDQRLAEAVEAHGRWQLLPHALRTSARRFEAEGRYRRYGLMALIMAMHVAGRTEFLAAVPTLYACQADTGRLSLRAHLGPAIHVFERAGLRETARSLWRLADAMVGEAWQLRLALALALAGPGRPMRADRFARDTPLLSSSKVFGPVHDLARLVVFFWLAIVIFGPVICLRFRPRSRERPASLKESS